MVGETINSKPMREIFVQLQYIETNCKNRKTVVYNFLFKDMTSFDYAYKIEAVRDWLFEQ